MMKLVCGMALASAAAPAVASEFSIGTSAIHSSGRYGGTEATRLTALSATGTIMTRGWEVSVTLPYLVVDAAGEGLRVGGVLIRPEGRQRISGLGDVSVSAGRSLSTALPVDVAVQAQLKLPVGSSNFSTGKIDGGLDVELSKEFSGFSPFLSAGYRFYGDTPDFELENGWAASTGASLTRGRWTLIASYDWSQSPIGLADAHEMFLVASGPLAANWNWSLYGSKGLSDGAADLMLGVGIVRSFGRRR